MNVLEKLVLSSAVFLGAIPLVGVLFSWLHIFGWYVLPPCLGIGLATFFMLENNEKVGKNWVWLGILFVLFSTVMFYGSFKYDWLEDGDPYGYALVASYVEEKHSFVKPTDLYLENYAEPDSIGYSLFIASWHSVIGRMNFVMKFFNALIISLSLLWCYCFSKKLFGNERKALFATFILFAIPSYLTHFIFATTLAVALFFPAFYFVMKSKDQWWFALPAGILIGSILVTHHLSGLVFGIFLVVYWLFDRNKYVFASGLAGVLLAMTYWVPVLIRYGIDGFKTQIGITSATSITGTGDVLYTFKHFFFASGENMINVSYGWGAFIFLLVIVGIAMTFIKKREGHHKVVWAWFAISLIGVLAVYLPYKLMPFRWWVYLAIPVALISGEALYNLASSKKIGFLMLAVWVGGVLAFSAVPKMELNTAVWGPSASLQHPGVLDAHLFMMNNFPDQTRVFSFHTASKLQGFNMWSCDWCADEILFKQRFPVRDYELQEFVYGLNARYEYVFVPVSWYVGKYGEDNTEQQIRYLEGSDYFTKVYQNQNAIIYKVN